ncbi:MAG: T9SS type A sorting domain-containing protein [Bacteroidota bacterium]
MALNQNIPTRFTMDDNQKKTNTVYLNHLGKLNDSTKDYTVVYDSIEISTLENVAYQNPLKGGDAVYMARAMLGIDVLDLEETLKSKLPPTAIELEKVNYFELYPNPNDGRMQLNYTINSNETGIVTIYSVLGEVISNYKLSNDAHVLFINEGDLKNGIYIYKVKTNDSIVNSGKIVVNK